MAKKSRNISFVISQSKTINATVNGKPYVVPSSHPGYAVCLQALEKDDPQAFIDGLNQINTVLNKIAEAGNIGIELRGEVIIDTATGRPIHSHLARTILRFQAEGLDFQPLLKFLGRLANNPSYSVGQNLYEFLKHGSLPITDEGYFLGYKRVNSEFRDLHTDTIDNTIGKTIQMDRRLVDDNNSYQCSIGFHVGTIQYVDNFRNTPNNPILLVKVDPADVVAVEEYGQKLRTCRYVICAKYTGNLDLAVYTADEVKKEVKSKAINRNKPTVKRVIKNIKKTLKKKTKPTKKK